jgi:hypothetical protein
MDVKSPKVVIILEARPVSNYEPWIKQTVDETVLPFTKYLTGIAIKQLVEHKEDVSKLGHQSFDDYLRGLDLEKLGYLKKAGVNAPSRRTTEFVDRRNLIEPDAAEAKPTSAGLEQDLMASEDRAEKKQDKREVSPAKEGVSYLQQVRDAYEIDRKDIADLRRRYQDLCEYTFMEQRAAYAEIRATIGKTSIDEANIDKDRWDRIQKSQNPFDLVEYMKEIHNKERGAVFEKKQKEFRETSQQSGESISSFVDRIDRAAEAVNLVASADKNLTDKDKSYRLVHGADIDLFDDLFKKYHQVATASLPSYSALVFEYKGNEDAVAEIKNRKGSGVDKGMVSTYAAVAGAGAGTPVKGAAEKPKDAKPRRCFTCEKYAKDPTVGYDHLKNDPKCPSKAAAAEKAKQNASAQQGKKKGGQNTSVQGDKRCQVCALFKEPASMVNTHVFSVVCPHFSKFEGAAPKAKMATTYFDELHETPHANWDHIADPPEAFMSKSIEEDPEVWRITTSMLGQSIGSSDNGSK